MPLQRRPPPATLGLVVQRQDGNSCGALGVAAWSGVHAAKFAQFPFVLIFLTQSLISIITFKTLLNFYFGTSVKTNNILSHYFRK